jgi:hypothetical protein
VTASQAEFGIVVAKDIMIPMRDGVRLATDVYWPAKDGERVQGRLPTILGRTSYDKNWRELWVDPVANFFTKRGYAVALQDLRGRYASEGLGQYHHTANVHEGEDGHDTIEWIAEQSWSSGRVGMVGSSHGGIVQTAASLTRPPHLTAIWVDVAPTNIFAHQSREGGAMSLQMFGALFLHAYDSQEIRDDPAARAEVIEGWENIDGILRSMPFELGETPLRAVSNLENVLFHYFYDGEYNDIWGMEICDQGRHFEKAADVPGVFSGGWYDPFAVAMTGQYAAMAGQNESVQRLLMGPWTHGAMRGGATYSGDVDFGPETGYGNAVYNGHRLRWFDRWLKDEDTGVEDDPPVRIFVMGGGDGGRNAEGRLNHGGVWRSENEWPLGRTVLTTYYLRSDGGLSTETPGVDDLPADYVHDPERPVPTIASSVTGLSQLVKVPEGVDPAQWPPRRRMRPVMIEGGAHQKEAPGIFGCRPPYPMLSARPDVRVFQSDPLIEDLEVTGAIDVTLWVSSSAIDTDFTAKLLDIYPPSEDYLEGYHLNLADSIIRMRFRNGYEREEMMDTGEVCRVRIALPPTSNLFMAGHRIRVDIAGSSFPKFDVNPNTGEPLGRHTHTVKARSTVYLDRERPSHVVLPIIPAPASRRCDRGRHCGHRSAGRVLSRT